MKLCVIGNPVKHSLSPRLHAAFAEQFGIALSYTILEVLPEAFEQTVAGLPAQGIIGANITIPYKGRALACAEQASIAAELAHAANTLKFEHGRCLADNTDGVGFLKGYNLEAFKGPALVIGAGGAARAIISALATRGSQVWVLNRDEQRLTALLNAFNHPQVRAFEGEQPEFFSLIVNATSASLSDQLPSDLPEMSFIKNTNCIDVVYSESGSTPFTEWATQAGASSVEDGWKMLVEQGAESFRWWTGKTPETQTLKAKRLSFT